MAGPSQQVSFFGKAGRFIGNALRNSEGYDSIVRTGSYGEGFALSLIRKQHLLCDEGSYRTTNNNAQSGIIANGATAFVATTPSLILFNNDSATNPNAKYIFLDQILLNTTVVGSAASGLVSLQMAAFTDSGNRFSSGGTTLTGNIINPNANLPANSIAQAYFGALTASAATAAQRQIVPFRVIRPVVSGTVLDVIGEQKLFNFGGVEGSINGSITIANANFIPVPMPPVILGPQQCFVLNLWQATGATNVAATYAPEIYWWER